METVRAMVVSFVCPCLPPDTFTMDDFDEAEVFGRTFMDSRGQSFEEPPTEADVAQYVATTAAAVLPPNPTSQVAEPQPPP